MEEIKNGILPVSMEDVLHNSMMPYAEYVILDRALPRVEDGLKPVQRRILYSMYDLGILPDKGYKKSARVVGDCLAKYHPHGDTSVYDAMVRLAQPFNMRMTLVDGHGNFGSVDGDSAAAMRYTEVKLQPLALELLSDLDKDTVDWQLNFDDSLKEPVTLPGRFPNLLVNGATGIAVGLATNIPTHNLAEVIDGAVALIDNPKIKLEEMMKIIKGPDFSTGGYIIAGDELQKAYETGKGKILIRAKCEIELDAGDKKNIVIHELPYQVNKAKLLEKIAEMQEKKDPNLEDVYDIVDESDRKGMRAVIKVRKDGDPEKILAYLYKTTNLQVSFGINMVAIAEGKPMQLGLLSILKYYVEYQREVVLRRTKFDLNKAKDRAHILEGLIIAVTNIDEVIKIIKNSPDTTTARQNLRKKFDLSEKQAQAILDLRLARLTKLEVNNLRQELKDLKALIKELQAIVDSKRLQMELVKTEITALKKKYKEDRRSKIVKTEKEAKAIRYDDVKPIENFVIGYTNEGKIRKIKESAYNRTLNQLEPELRDVFLFKCNISTGQTALFMTNSGNCFKVSEDDIPEAKGKDSNGVLLKDIAVGLGEKEDAVAVFATDNAKPISGDVVFFTKYGSLKKTNWSELLLLKSAYQVMKLKDDDEVICVKPAEDDKDLFFVTLKGMCLRAENNIGVYGRVAGGIKGIELDSGDKVVYAGFVKVGLDTVALIGTSFGTFKKVLLGTVSRISRARKGVKICDLGDEKYNECVVYADVIEDASDIDIVILDRMGSLYYLNSKSIPVDSRVSKGKIIKEVGKCQPFCVYPTGQLKQ